MALGTVTRVGNYGGGEPGSPVFIDNVSFLGDGAYPAGGTLNFSTLVEAIAAMNGKTMISAFMLWCSTHKYVAKWDYANDKLHVYDSSADAEGSGDLSGTTFVMTVISQ